MNSLLVVSTKGRASAPLLIGCDHIDIMHKCPGSHADEPLFMARRPHPEQQQLGTMRYYDLYMQPRSSSRSGITGGPSSGLEPVVRDKEQVWKVRNLLWNLI